MPRPVPVAKTVASDRSGSDFFSVAQKGRCPTSEFCLSHNWVLFQTWLVFQTLQNRLFCPSVVSMVGLKMVCLTSKWCVSRIGSPK